MKIEKITDKKIKIILSLTELNKHNIDINTIINNTNLAQKLFKKILHQAEKEVGFKTSNSKLLIEAYYSPNNSFTITFTKLELITHNSQNTIFKFESFKEFCNFCTYFNKLNKENYNKLAKKFKLYKFNNYYFLVCSKIKNNFLSTNKFYSLISEFAEITNTSPYFENILIEYGKIIFKHNALIKSIKYFS